MQNLWYTYANSLHSLYGIDSWYGKGQEKSYLVYIYDKLIGYVTRIPNEYEIFEAKRRKESLTKREQQIQYSCFRILSIDFSSLKLWL